MIGVRFTAIIRQAGPPPFIRTMTRTTPQEDLMKKVAIVMGSASDKPIALDAVKTLEEYGVPSVVRVLSAHRTPQEARDFTLSLEAQDVGAVIALAGMAAHLAGAVAANTVLPVIGVPVASGGLGGLDALLSTVQMPSGIPVATVAVGGAKNAAILAVQILAVSDTDLRDRLTKKRADMRAAVLQADKEINEALMAREA